MEGETRLHVLYVDDNRDVADSAAELLRIAGFEVRVCYDGPTALAVSRNFTPSICLLDLDMPGMNGDELAVRLREQSVDGAILVVAVTARSDDVASSRIAAAGFNLHLVKPVDPHDLLRILDELSKIGQHSSRPPVPR